MDKTTIRKILTCIPLYGIFLEFKYNVIDSTTWLGVLWGIYHIYATLLIGMYLLNFIKI